MKNKILLFTLYLFLIAVVNSLQADPSSDSSATDTKDSAKVVKTVNEKSTKEVNKSYEPANRFTPTEKLRADDTVTFPVDI